VPGFDDPHLAQLFPGGDGGGDPRDPATLYTATLGLFALGAYVPNPVSDPDQDPSKRSLADWWKGAYDAFRSALPAKATLPEGSIDKGWADQQAALIEENLRGLESATNRQDRRGYANLAIQKLTDLNGEVNLEALAAVEGLGDVTNALTDASFTTAKAVVARTLNDDRVNESVAGTFNELELTDAGSTFYSLGGDPPDDLQIPTNRAASEYLDNAADGVFVSMGENSAGQTISFGPLFENALDAYEKTGNAGTVRDVANCARQFQQRAWEQVRAEPDNADPLAAMAMVCGEAMRNVTGAVRPNQQGGVTGPLSTKQEQDLRDAGASRADDLRDEVEKTDPYRNGR
jgi:hypothetical protein